MFLYFLIISQVLSEEITPADYVNPYMGGVSHMLVPCYPTIHLPNGLLRLIPDRSDFDSASMNGFPAFLLSHRGSYVFQISASSSAAPTPQSSSLTPVQEIIRPYYYSAYFEEHNFDVRIAPSFQSAIYEITFHDDAPKTVLITSRNGDMSESGDGFSGVNYAGCPVYLYAEADPKPSSSEAMTSNQETSSSSNANSITLKYPASVKTVRLRVGFSFISKEQAQANVLREIKTFNFGTTCSAGKAEWNRVLGKIAVKGGSEDEKAVFYTSMYRTYERMCNISEDGQYFSGFDRQVHDDEGISFFTDDWIWDTFRAVHPLRCLIDRKKEEAMLVSYLRMAEQSGDKFLPTFPEVYGDSARMNGKHSIATLWDAWVKGIRNFNLTEAFEASKKTQLEATLIPWTRQRATTLDFFYQENGYYPGLKSGEPETCYAVNGELRQCVAITQGAAYDDWCIAGMADELNKTSEYRFWDRRAYNYRNLFKPDTRFFHPRDKEGRWIEPFDYRFSGGRGGREYYDENNGWTYRWDVQHHPSDLVALMGGDVAFAEAMDDMFKEPLGATRSTFLSQWPDQTSTVGQFTMANEPSMHIPFFYNHAMHPWKTQKVTRFLLHLFFRNDIMGVPGDEDGGGLSAFAVFAAIGLYPFTPGLPYYLIGSPVFEEVKMNLENGNTFTIHAIDVSPVNKYIQSATLNDVEYYNSWISHDSIMNGATLVLQMGPKPNRSWGIGERPPAKR